MVIFLLQTVIISLSGVMAPGAVTAATLSQGSKNRWAGLWIALGHGIVEIPLIFLLLMGFGTVLKTDYAKTIIGIVGGAFLVYLGIVTFCQRARPVQESSGVHTSKPLTTGIALSATNPYFLFWWATVGLNLAFQAKNLGSLAMVSFAVVHWLCDLIWLMILSLAAFHGTSLLGSRNQRMIPAFCGMAMVFFGLKFLYGAVLPIFR